MAVWKKKLRQLMAYLPSKDDKQIKALSRELKAKHNAVLVLGSAPDAALPRDWPQDGFYITVNASQASPVAATLAVPGLTVISAQTLGELETNVQAKAALRGRATGRLLFIEQGFSWKMCRKKFEQMNYRYNTPIVMSPEKRALIIRRVIGDYSGQGNAEDRTSNGIFAICLALYAGAPKVLVSGFSLAGGGHAYSTSNHARVHIDADRQALQKIAQRYDNIFAVSEKFAADSGLKLLTF